MRETSKQVLLAALGAALLAASGAGCSVGDDSGGDKAGGSSAPTVLRLAAADDADQPDARFVRRFASQVQSSPADRCACESSGTPPGSRAPTTRRGSRSW